MPSKCHVPCYRCCSCPPGQCYALCAPAKGPPCCCAPGWSPHQQALTLITVFFASKQDPSRVLCHDSERRAGSGSQGALQSPAVPAAELCWEGVCVPRCRAPLAPVSPAVCCRFCSCAVQQNKPKLVCLLGLQGAVLQPWKLVSYVSLASAVPVSQGTPLKCFQLLAAPLKCPAGKPAAHPRAARQAAAAAASEAQLIVLPWHSPSGSAVLGVCAWRQDGLWRCSRVAAACTMRGCQRFRGDGLWPLDVLSAAVRAGVPVPWREHLSPLPSPSVGRAELTRAPGPAGTCCPGCPSSRHSPGHCAEAGPCPGVLRRGGGLHLASSLSCAPLGKESMI